MRKNQYKNNIVVVMLLLYFVIYSIRPSGEYFSPAQINYNKENVMITTSGVIKIFNISLERLRTWLLADFITPCKASEGQGSKAYFSNKGIFILACFVYLTEDLGMKRKDASDLLKPLHNWQPNYFLYTTVAYCSLSKGKRWYLYKPIDDDVVLTLPFKIIIDKYLHDYYNNYV